LRKVDVCIDETWEQEAASQVDGGGIGMSGTHLRVGATGGDTAVTDEKAAIGVTLEGGRV
jgi:hypothetical protein